MDKRSEQSKQSKSRDDTDHGVHDYGAGGKREQLNGLWRVPTIVGGSYRQRIIENNYCKVAHEEGKGSKEDLVESLLNNGEPMENISHPRAVANYRS